jgi:hypothetical protein
VCLSEIPKDRIKKSDKNNKSYCQIVIDERKELDKFGNTHTLYMNQTKEERADKVSKVYVGGGKELVFGSKQTTTKQPDSVQSDYEDDLPF